MTRPRDTQRQKVYDAENKVTVGTKFETLEECEVFLAKVCQSKYLVKKYGWMGRNKLTEKSERRIPLPRLIRGRAGTRAWASSLNTITLPEWCWNERIILHELAHLLNSSVRMHDWKFCEIYLDLVRHIMGKETHDALKASFKTGRVKFTKPRAKRELTEEQKQVLRERLTKAREAKANQREALADVLDQVESFDERVENAAGPRPLRPLASHRILISCEVAYIDCEVVGRVARDRKVNGTGGYLAQTLDGETIGTGYPTERAAVRAIGTANGMIGPYDRIH